MDRLKDPLFWEIYTCGGLLGRSFGEEGRVMLEFAIKKDPKHVTVTKRLKLWAVKKLVGKDLLILNAVIRLGPSGYIAARFAPGYVENCLFDRRSEIQSEIIYQH